MKKILVLGLALVSLTSVASKNFKYEDVVYNDHGNFLFPRDGHINISQRDFAKGKQCFATYRNGFQKGQTVKILEVESGTRSNVMARYKVGNRQWLYATAFKDFMCK